MLASVGYGKPYTAEKLFVEKDLHFANFVQNQDINKPVSSETEEMRHTKNLLHQKTPSTRSKQRLSYCDIVCKKVSFACLSGVPKVTILKCILNVSGT